MTAPSRREPQMSPWEARVDVAFGHGLRLLASGRLAEARPDICLFLADRYWRLADWHAAKGHERRARRLHARGDRFWVAGGGEDPPPLAVAAAMPIPRRPSITWAVGNRSRRPEPPDAA
jgi:hypothetical protein